MTRALRSEHLLGAYRIFVLSLLKPPRASLMPSPHMVRKLNACARRALLACANRDGDRATLVALLEVICVFDTLAERRRSAFAVFVLSFAVSTERFADSRGALTTAFATECRADSPTVGFDNVVRDLGLPPPPATDLGPATRRWWRGVVVSAARTAARARPATQARAARSGARSDVAEVDPSSHSQRDDRRVQLALGRCAGRILARLAERALHDALTRGLGLPAGRCDWYDQGHTHWQSGATAHHTLQAYRQFGPPGGREKYIPG